MIEQHVTSLGLSKKLHDIGVKQESIFYWVECLGQWKITSILIDKDVMYFNEMKNDKIMEFERYSAFLPSELFQIIPSRVYIKEQEPFGSFRLSMYRSLIQLPTDKTDMYFNYLFSLNYYCDTFIADGEETFFSTKLIPHNIYDENLSNALAKLVIYLHENGHIKNENI